MKKGASPVGLRGKPASARGAFDHRDPERPLPRVCNRATTRRGVDSNRAHTSSWVEVVRSSIRVSYGVAISSR